MPDNILYYGDNLAVLREHVRDESVDLVYLDPPFNSNATYNVLFAEKNGSESAAQIKAFDDTWHWDENAARTYEEVVESGGRVSEAMRAFRTFLGTNDMLAYLTMMAPRLVELRRVLKPTGSIYLHCDPTAGHYLKMLMDAVFGGENFRNEVVWKRTSGHSDADRCGRVHDVLLYYRRGLKAVWNKTHQAYDTAYLEQYYRYTDKDSRRFMSADLTGAGSGPPREFGKRGSIAPPSGRHWMYDQAGIDRLLKEKRIYWTRNGIPRLKVYLDEVPGMPLQDVWTDVQALRSWHKERLGYQTQKPEALLERIIKASSNEGDVVLDPFCGCGTTIAVAQKLNRRWLGIDITHLAISLIKSRLQDAFGESVKYRVVGEPTDIAGAEALAGSDPYQFQWWALGLVGARPVEQKKGADKGIDGRIYFHDDPAHSTQTKQIILSVKAGHVTVSQVRDLVGVVDREDAQIGVLVSFNEATGPMRAEAASAGFYESPWGKHPRIQLITIGELLGGKKIDFPYTRGVATTFRRAPKHNPGDGVEQTNFIDEET